jgi:hypothetical protein
MSVSHNHSSPYYSSPSWGVWAFQDVFDIRFFEYYAQRQARAVMEAEAHLVPVRMGATVVKFDKTHRHSFGPQSPSVDGTPAGYPQSDADHDMTIARFDEITATGTKPLAIMANFALHPEFLDGNDLITGDYIAPLERFVGRETGATLIFSQGSVGTAEPERSTYHSIHERLEFTHREYAQAEYGARLMADAVIGGWNDVAAETPETAGRFVPFGDAFGVKVFDRFFPGPLSHPLPTVSNCRTDTALAGNPQAPILGLPDCTGPGNVLPVDPGVRTDTLEAAGVPVPENYSAVSYTGLEEDIGVHLQAVKMGDLLVTVCSCEQWKDQSYNIKSRTERSFPIAEWLGFDWSDGYSYNSGSFTESYGACTQGGDGKWTCPRHPSVKINDFDFQRMKAQISNDAKGWNEADYVLWAESEPTELDDIKGNFTHGGLPEGQRYGLTMAMAMSNDYNGYLASYREYQRGDHYRKALTGWGPHSQDYMATRLKDAAGWLNGGAAVPAEPLDAKEIADQAHNDARAAALGTIGATTLAAFEAALPADGGPARIVKEPDPIEHFGAAFFSWVGGSNYTDSPVVRVERKRTDGSWEQAADMSGEVPLTLKFPTLPDAPAVLTGGYEYEWTATFEAFASRQTSAWDPTTHAPLPPKDIVDDTKPGTYRFVVNGVRRGGMDACPDTFGIAPIPRCENYQFTSREFSVGSWSGITVPTITAEGDGSVSFTVGPASSVTSPIGPVTIGPIDYPDSYAGGARFIAHNRRVTRDPAFPNDPNLFEWYCDECSFRPWADTGTVATAFVTIDPIGDGPSVTVPATLGGDGRYHTAAGVLSSGQQAYVDAQGIIDNNGEYNGARSATVDG